MYIIIAKVRTLHAYIVTIALLLKYLANANLTVQRKFPCIFTGGPGPIFSLPMDGLGPGSYTYNITAFSPDGQRSTSVIAFAVPGITTLCACLLSNLNLQLSYIEKALFMQGVAPGSVCTNHPSMQLVHNYTKY